MSDLAIGFGLITLSVVLVTLSKIMFHQFSHRNKVDKVLRNVGGPSVSFGMKSTGLGTVVSDKKVNPQAVRSVKED